MKYLVVFAFSVFMYNSAVAQNCNYEIDEIDKFSEEETKLTEALVIARKVKREGALPLRKILAQLRKVGNRRTMVLKFPMTMVMSPTFTSNSNSKLVLLLENNERITLRLDDLMRNMDDKVELRYATDFVLKPKDIELLKQYTITDMRVAMRSNTFDVKLDQDAARSFRENFHCIE